MQGDVVAIGAMGVGTPRIALTAILDSGEYSYGEIRCHHERFACGHISGYQHKVLSRPSSSVGRG